VARKKKKKRATEEPEPEVKLGGDAKTSMRALLDGITIEPPKPAAARAEKKPPPPKPVEKKQVSPPPGERPSDTLRGDDRIAYWDAFKGVRPIGGKAAMHATDQPRLKSAPKPHHPPGDDEVVRARLAALVAGGVRFDVERKEDGRVLGLRAGAQTAVLRELSRRDASPEAVVDLHGMTAVQAEQEVAKFVRRQHRAGASRVRIVHGKGLHSAGGAVLGDRVVHALTNGAAAPVVLAFASAAPELGGVGALIVELTRA
jgi:DNA-nicking Smr family endonuclease